MLYLSSIFSKITTSFVAGPSRRPHRTKQYASVAGFPAPRIWRFKRKLLDSSSFSKAFTLVELMVVLGIFAVLTSVVVYKYRDFNNSIILTNVAYEVGLLVRQAQVYGLSVKGSGAGNFDNGYGVYVIRGTTRAPITPGLLKLFADDGDKMYKPNDTTIDTLLLPTGYSISGLNTFNSQGNFSGKKNASIVFVRPNPKAYIVGDGQSLSDNVPEIHIDIKSPSGATKTIIVWHTGQISVK